MLLVDVHAHLDHERFKGDLDAVIERARIAGVKAIITSGVNSTTNRIVLDLSKKYEIVKASFGLYPIDALDAELQTSSGFSRDVEPLDVDAELDWIKKHKENCVSIGEAGLDYHWIQGKEKEQKITFQKVIALAEKIKKPLVVHSRKAELDAVEMLESSSLKKNIIMHCFMGRKHLVKRAADNGWSFSIPPIIVKLQQFQLLAEIANMNQILTETDCPYLSPFPGQRNEPAYVIETVKKIAEVKGMVPEEVANAIFMNYQQLF